jgi:hypothetical protein
METVHPDDVAFKVRTWLKNLETETPHLVVCRFRGADGQYRWFEVRGEPLRASDGTVLSWYGVLIDIDDRRRLQATLNVIPAYTWYAAPSGGLTFVNKRTADYLGLPKDHPLRFGIDMGAQFDAHIPFLHPDDQEGARNAWPAILSRGEASEYSFRVRNAQGGYRWFLSRVEPLRASDGTLLQWVGVNLDIEELKCAEQALRESEAKFRDYAETASDWFCEIGPDYKFTLLTGNAVGFDPAGRIGTACWDHALDLETEPEKWRLIRATLESRKPFRDFVYCAMGGNGLPMYVKASGKPVFDGDGEFRGYRGTGTDVTATVRAQEAQQRREAYLAEAQRLSQTGSWAWSPDDDIRYWSEECYRVLSFDPRDGLPRFEEFVQRIHPDDQPGFRKLIEGAIREKAEWEADYRIVHLDGSVRDIHVVGHPVLSTSGHLVEFVGTVIDVTERRRAEQERARLRQVEADLAHMNRLSMMGELVASLAHEITQPIATARNNARAALNFLDRQPPDLGEVREALGCVVGDADRAGVIIDRIRDHIKKAPPRKHRFDLNEAINEVIGLAQSAIAVNEVSVQTRLSDGLAPVEGDRVQLQQVILNLVLNAAEAMTAVHKGARDLLISSEQNRTNGVLVTVRDSGPGIDPERIERVFDAFYTTKPSGMGMGLSICRSIIDAHGGRLWADANERKGAAFQFSLPGSEVSS